MLTQPLEASRLLEAVQRCLSAPRQASVERATASADLLTSEEIFGDVLRELEEVDGLGLGAAPAPAEPVAPPPAPVAAAPPIATPSPPAPSASAAPASAPQAAAHRTEPAPLAPVPAPALPDASGPEVPLGSGAPVVSLAGLFDGEPIGDVPQAASAPAVAPEIPEPSRRASEDLDSLWGSAGERDSAAHESDWQGGERRSSERPWTSPASDTAAATSTPDEVVPEPIQPEPLETPVPVIADATAASEAPVDSAPVAPPETENDAEAEAEAGSFEDGAESGLRVPRVALIVGSLAAVLLIVLGVIFLRNPGADAESSAVAEPAPAASDGAAESTPSTVEKPVVEARASDPQEAAPAAVDPVAEDDQMESLDLQAIVDQELERREEELRQVFLEEEKRLLRELGNLDSEKAAEEGDGGDDGSGSGG
jgi:hypothetical protein